MTIEISFVSKVTNLSEFEELLLEYYSDVLQVAQAAGVPKLAPEDLVKSSVDHLDEMLPPNGRLALARGADGRLLGCGTLRRIRPDAVEMKRMFVRPEARGKGLGQHLFEMRIEEARKMGCRAVYADTAKGNRPMLAERSSLMLQETCLYDLKTSAAYVSIALEPNIEFFMHRCNSDGVISTPMHTLWLGRKRYTNSALLLAQASTDCESGVQPSALG